MSKFEKGEVIRSLDELSKQDYIYWHEKVYHHGFFKSWQLRMIETMLNKGQIFKAIKKGEEK